MQKGTRLTTALAVIPVAALMAVTSACSSGDKPNGEEKKKPDQVVTDAKNALKAAKTVHLVGSVTETEAGQKQTVAIDLRFLNGTGATGSITTSGKKLELVRVGNDLYAKGGADVLGSAAAIANGKYVKLSATSTEGKDLAGFTDLKAFADQSLTPDSTLKNAVEKGKVDGKKAVILTSNDSGGPSKLYIANTGDPVPLQITGSGSSSGKMAFTEYNKDVTITAPTDVVPLPNS